MKTFLLFILLLPLFVSGQNSANTDPWSPFKSFIGNWKGEGGGEPGKGTYQRSYQFIMGSKFIEVRNKSTFAPSANNPNGEVHEDLGYISYDKSLKKFRLRQFHSEGFVNEYILDSISPDMKTMVFITESIENISKGWRAKETYRIPGENKLEETFELAAPQKDFEVYSKVQLIKEK